MKIISIAGLSGYQLNGANIPQQLYGLDEEGNLYVLDGDNKWELVETVVL